MTGVAALAFAATFTSCSKTDLYDENKVNEEKAANINATYAAAFEKAFGKVGSNVDWGFSSRATTRLAQPNSNQWGTTDDNSKYIDWPKPADITDEERAAVLEVFNQKGKESYTDLLNLTDFFVQQVYCGPNGGKMNQLACWDPEGHDQTIYGDPSHNYEPYTIFTHDDEVNNFNGGKYDNNALQGCMLMWNSSTSQWSFKTSQSGGERIYDHWRMEKINGNYYVGLDHEAWRQAPANANEEDKRDYIYNDWIIKIVPGKGAIPDPLYRVIAEDLSATDASDFDFNDVVFDVVKAENGKTTLKLICAGGTLPLRVRGANEAEGREVHDVFGQSSPDAQGKYKMYNTGAGPTVPEATFTVEGEYTTPEQIKNIIIEVKKGDVWMPLPANRGEAACKILVDDTFEPVAERRNIANENKKFTNYVQGTFVDDFWWK